MHPPKLFFHTQAVIGVANRSISKANWQEVLQLVRQRPSTAYRP